MKRTLANSIFRAFLIILCGLVLSKGALHAQDGVLRQWQAVRYLDASQVDRQLPVFLDGSVVFVSPERSFFILGEGGEGVPVQRRGGGGSRACDRFLS